MTTPRNRSEKSTSHLSIAGSLLFGFFADLNLRLLLFRKQQLSAL